MNFTFILNIFFWNFLLFITALQEQDKYLFPGENIMTPELRYYVPFQQQFFDSQDIQFNIELIKEVKIDQQSFNFLSNNTKLLYFQNITNEDDNMIMVLDNSNIYCLYLIKNYLQDHQIIMIPHFCNITLPYQSCNQLEKVNKEIFISNCYINKNQSIISIINLDGKVYDQIILEIETNCKIQFSYGNFYLFIYNQECESNNFYYVEIDEQQYQYKSLQKFNIALEDNSTYNSFGQILKMVACNKSRSMIIYNNTIMYYNHQDKSFYYSRLGANSTILNVFEVCIASSFIFSFEGNSQQLKFDSYDLNVNYIQNQYINSLLIEKMLVLHFKDCIMVKIHDQLQQQIDIQLSEILPIIESEYFVGLYKSELKLYKLYPPKYYHSFNISQRIIFLIFPKWNFLQSFSLQQCNIEIIKQNDPKLIINNVDIINKQNNKNQICIEQASISKSLPINVYIIQQNTKYYSINSTYYIESTNLYFFGELSKVLFFFKLNDITNILLVQIESKDLIILVFYQKDIVVKKYNIKIHNKYIDICILQKYNIFIFYEYYFEYYRIDDQFQIHKKEFILEKKIIKIDQYYNQVVITYDNCKLSIVNCVLEDIVILDQFENYPFDCTEIHQIGNSNLYIYKTQIFHKQINVKKYFQVGKIIKVLGDIDQSLYLAYIDEENEIILKVFRVIRGDLVFMYKLPTYVFKIESFINFKLENGYLMINAKRQNKTFLLVYYLKNQAINSLIYITEIDPSQYFFQFFDYSQKTIVYLKDGKFYFYDLNQICINYTLNIENTIIQKKQFDLVVNTLIYNLTQTTKIDIYQLNSDYSLILLNEKMRIIIIDKCNLDFDQIRGNIDKFEIQPKQDFIIKLPLNITREYFTCNYYESNICIHDETTIEIKSLNLKEYLHFQFQSNTIKSIVFYQESLTYSIFYINSQQMYCQLILYLRQNQSNNQYIISKIERFQIEILETEIFHTKKIKNVKNITILFQSHLFGQLYYNHQCQIIDLYKTNKQYYLIDGAYLQNNTYVFVYYQRLITQITIISFNNIQITSELECKGDIIQYKEINLLKILERIYTQTFEDLLIQIEIIHIEMKGNIFVMKFILIYKIYLILVLEVSFDSIKYDNFEILQYRFLRYNQDAQFLDLLYADNNFIVLTVSMDTKEFINVYDIKGDKKYKDYLDSIQRIESFQYKKIEKFNSSHYVIISYNNNTVLFMTLNQLTIECQGQCNEPANLILSNDVSSISLKIEISNIQDLNVYFIIILLMINQILILIYIKLKKSYIKKQDRKL